MSKNISTQYYLQQKLSYKTSCNVETNSSKEYILEKFKNLCEAYPKNKYLVFRKQIIQETIVESEDYDQLTMALV